MADETPDNTTTAVASSSRSIPIWLAIALGIFLLIEVALFVTLWRTNEEVSGLRADVEALSEAASTSVPSLGSIGAASAGPQPTDATSSSSAADQNSSLPRFVGSGADPALGRTLGSLAAPEYYGGESVVVDPGDGTSRAFMIWAHWCPYCQEELPLMAEWHDANATQFENFEIVSVTTAIDETASNPLVPYLDQSQFPFPVLVDEDGGLSQEFGANAYPFWVFTAPDGTVVGRAAGLIRIEELEAVFSELNNLGIDA